MLHTLHDTEIRALLAEQVIGNLGCADEKEIYVFPIAYAYDNGVIYGHTYEGTKVDILRAHPRMCLQVSDVQSPNGWRSAMAHGVWEEVAAADIALVMRILFNHFSSLAQPWDAFLPFYHDGTSFVVRDDGTHSVFFRLRIDSLTGKCER